MSTREQALLRLWDHVSLAELDQEEVAQARYRLTLNSDDALARMQLLCQLAVRHERGELGREELIPHVLWFAEHAPFLPLANSVGIILPGTQEAVRCADIWSSVLERRDVPAATLQNALAFRTQHGLEGGDEVAEELLRNHPLTPRTLLECARHELASTDRGVVGHSYTAAAAHCERLWSSGRQAPAAFIGVCYYMDQRGDVIESVLSRAREQCSAATVGGLHAVQTIEGLLAIDRGGIGDARVLLLQSLPMRFGPLGPSLRLARRLAMAGEWDHVERFLGQVQGKWREHAAPLGKWLGAAYVRDSGPLTNPGV